MGVIRTFVNVLFIVIFLVLLLAVNLSLSGGVLFDSEVYHQSFENNGVYDNVENVFGNVPGGELISLGVVNETGEALLDNFFDYLTSESNEPNLTLEINQSAFYDFLESRVEALPECTPAEAREFDYTLSDLEGVECLPASLDSEQVVENIIENQNLSDFADGEVNLGDVYGLKSEEFQGIRNGVYWYLISRYIILFALLVALAVLLLVDMREPSRLLFPFGIALVIAGAVSGVLAIFIPDLLINLFKQAEITGGELAVQLIGSTLGIIRDIAAEVVARSLLISGGFILLGIVSLVVGLIAHRSKFESEDDENE